MALPRQLARRGQSGKSGTDDDHVDDRRRLCHVV
jgi:hypothetical protein